MVGVRYRSEWNFRGIPLLALMLLGQVSWFPGVTSSAWVRFGECKTNKNTHGI